MGFYEEFQSEIDKLPFCRGEAQLAQIQAVIAVAEKHGDTDAAIEWYRHLLRAASHQGRFDYELGAFSAMRKFYETDLKYKDLRGLILWYFKWIVERLPEHVEIPLELIDTTFDQMVEFYRREGESLRPVYALKSRCYAFLGKTDDAKKFYELWETTDTAKFDDCPACQTHGKVQYLLDMNQSKEAIEAAAPIIAGEQKCEEVPTATFSRLLMPLLFDGQGELANRMCHFVLRAVRKTPKFTSYFANNVVFLALTGRAHATSRLAKLLLGRGSQQPNSYHRMCAWRAAWVWLMILRNEGTETVVVPRAVVPSGHGQEMPVTEAVELCRNEAFALAQAFDARSGTDHFMPSLQGLHQMLNAPPPAGEDNG